VWIRFENIRYILGCDTIRSERNFTYFEGVSTFRVEDNINFVHFANADPFSPYTLASSMTLEIT